MSALKKTLIGITVVGKDKEGIVANFTNFVFERKGNLERVNQNASKVFLVCIWKRHSQKKWILRDLILI